MVSVVPAGVSNLMNWLVSLSHTQETNSPILGNSWTRNYKFNNSPLPKM